MKKAGKLIVLGMIAMGVLSACGTKDEPNGAASKDVEMKVSKKSNSKYIYINAIVHTKEEGISSEYKRTIVLDGNGRYIKCQE